MKTPDLANHLNITTRLARMYNAGTVPVPAKRVAAYCRAMGLGLEEVRPDLYKTGLRLAPVAGVQDGDGKKLSFSGTTKWGIKTPQSKVSPQSV